MIEKTGFSRYDDQCENATRHSYDKHAKTYAEKWEWNPQTLSEIMKYNIAPFSSFCKKGGRVLIVGSGTGRDYKLLTEKGFDCLGIDYSEGMIEEARQRVDGKFSLSDIRDFTDSKSYDGIYCESVFTHLSAEDREKVINNIHGLLGENGILYAAVKIGEPGIYRTNDIGGDRFFNVIDKEVFISEVQEKGFQLMYLAESNHTEKDRPKWLSTLFKKI